MTLPTGSNRQLSGTCTRGFTLLELLTVLSVLAIMFAIMVPLFRGSFSNLQVRDAVRNFAATVRFAQEQAIVRGIEYRVCIDDKDMQYWVSRQEDPAKDPEKFVTVLSDSLRPITFPAGLRLRIRSAAKGKQDDRSIRYIACYPNGRVAEAELSLQGPDRNRYLVRTAPTIGGVRIVEPRR